MPVDLYDILGVKPDADADTIRRAYREKAKRCHPDTVPEEDAQSFRQLQEAYEILGDAERRRRYDTHRQAAPGAGEGRRAPFGGSPGFRSRPPRFSADLWESWFADFLDRSAAGFSDDGGGWELILTPEEARRGGRVQLALPLDVPCEQCGGGGWTAGSGCRDCGGQGLRQRRLTLVVDLPPGLTSGRRLIVSGPRLSFAAQELILTVRVGGRGF
jgi:DnaJ-class molecular chaperone